MRDNESIRPVRIGIFQEWEQTPSVDLETFRQIRTGQFGHGRKEIDMSAVRVNIDRLGQVSLPAPEGSHTRPALVKRSLVSTLRPRPSKTLTM